MRNFNLQLRLARVTVGKTQLDIALEAQTNQTRVSLFERGLATPSPEEARRIAAILGSEPEKIFPQSFEGGGNMDSRLIKGGTRHGKEDCNHDIQP